MRSLPTNLRFAFRQIARRPGFAAVIVLTVALGIGANTAIFSLVAGVLLRPLPYPDADRLVAVWPETVTSVRATEWLAEETPTIAGVSGLSVGDFALTGDAGTEAERVYGARVSPGHFDVLEARPLLGRTFRAEESNPDRSAVVVLDHALWRARYGGDPDIVGRTIRIDYRPYTVVGVMPADFRPLEARFRLWVPQPVEPGATVETDGTWWVTTRIGRLAPGATRETAERDLRAAAVALAGRIPTEVDARRAALATAPRLQEALVGSVDRTLWILLGAVGLVLLVACANVANLLLSRVPSLRRDMALRTALGASRGRVMSQLLAESLVLALLGGALGVALARGALDVLRAMAPAGLPRLDGVAIDIPVLLFAIAASLSTALLFGLIPAIRATGTDVASVIGGGRGAARGSGGGRLAAGLIAAQVAIAVVLVVGAGLMVRTVRNLTSVDPGFRPEGVLTMQVSIPPSAEGGGPDLVLYRRMWTELAALPGVEAVGGIHVLPLGSGNNRYPFWAEGNEPAAGAMAPVANIRVATPGYLDVMRIPLEEGRWFTDADRLGTTPVIVLNRSLADRLWPGESAVGREIRLLAEDGIAWRVVGVVSDVTQMALARDPSGEMYLPHEQWTWPSMYVTLLAAGPAEAMAPAAMDRIRRLDPDITVSRVSGMERIVAASIASDRFLAGIMGAFGILALVLGAVGVYGVVASGVARRVPEFAVRMALGSTGSDILGTTLGHGLGPVAIGVAVGIAGAWGATRLLSSLLFEVSPTDPATYASVALVLAAVATVAWWIPARRAVRIDPLAVLREE